MMMPNAKSCEKARRWLSPRRDAIGVVAGVFAALWAVWIWFMPAPPHWPWPSEAPPEWKGHLQTDVLNALRFLGELPESGDRRTIEDSIRRAEQRLGLPTDGLPDESLLQRLIAEIESDWG